MSDIINLGSIIYSREVNKVAKVIMGFECVRCIFFKEDTHCKYMDEKYCYLPSGKYSDNSISIVFKEVKSLFIYRYIRSKNERNK